MDFLVKPLTEASIKTLQQNLPTIKFFFFIRIVDQENKSHIITFDLLALTTFHREKTLY